MKHYTKRVIISILCTIVLLGIANSLFAQYATEKDKLESINIPEHIYKGAIVTGEADVEKLNIRWEGVGDPDFSSYRVVVSKTNITPKFPEDGYLYEITDKNVTNAVIDNTEPYKNGDFGEKLIAGQSYYISISVEYKDRVVSGNTVQLTFPVKVVAKEIAPAKTSPTIVSNEDMPGTTPPHEIYPSPYVRYSRDEKKVSLIWDKVDHPNFLGIAVVISKNNPNPTYPQDGYLAFITDKNKTVIDIDNSIKYTNGDFGDYLIPGEVYHVKVFSVYTDRNVMGYYSQMVYPINGAYGPSLKPITDLSTREDQGISLRLSWMAPNPSYGLTGYRVSMSKTDPNTSYPKSGYLKFIPPFSVSNGVTVPNNGVVVWAYQPYYGGDFGVETLPATYYFNVTAMYGDIAVPGPVIRANLPNTSLPTKP